MSAAPPQASSLSLGGTDRSPQRACVNPMTDDQALSLSLAISRAHASLQQVLDERLGRWHGLGYADFRLLGALADAPQGRLLTLQLAAALHLAPSTLVRQLMPLEKTGLVAREAGAVHLRPAARRLHAEATQTAGAACGQALAAIGTSPETAADLLTHLTKLARPPMAVGAKA